MKINGQRFLSELKSLREMTDTPGQGVTRFSYGENDIKARAFFAGEARKAGLAYRTDAVGNIYIWDPAQAGPDKIMIGSHMDSVQNGGWLDGAYGTMGAFEVLRRLKEEDALASNIELVIFAEEEGSNFSSTTTGSKFATGVYKDKDLDELKNPKGTSLRDMVEACDFPPYKEEDVIWDYGKVKAMLELHIEQGPVLDEGENKIGIVEKVNGMEVMEFTFEGLGNHAGASPMSYRKDALVAASLAIARIEGIAKSGIPVKAGERPEPDPRLVATVGRLTVEPNSSNVIPGKATFTVEVRHVDKDIMEATMAHIIEAVEEVALARDVKWSKRKVADSVPISFDRDLVNLIEETAKETGLKYQRMNSGAVHDASMVGIHVPAAMIFVPSIGGRSHVAFEDTKEEDLLTGVQLLLDTLLALQSK